jgi:hypothetical protein
MDVFCINTNNPEFQKLLAESGMKQGVFAMAISKWMAESGIHNRYPTLQELSITTVESVKPTNALKSYQTSDEDIIEELVQENKLERKCQ